MKSLRIGFIGAGLVAHGHALCLRSIQDNQDELLRGAELILAKVYDIDQEKASIFAEQHSFLEVSARPEEIFNDPSINVVYICTPTSVHKKYFLQAAAGKKDIFIEKPLAFSSAEIQKMIAAQKNFGIKAQVGLVLRFEPVYWYINKIIKDNAASFGKLLTFHFRSDQEWPITGSRHDSEWRSNPGEAFAGCLFEHSIHDVDLIRMLFGDPESVSAHVGYQSSLSQNKIEDCVTSIFRFPGGGSGNLTSMYHRIKDRDVRRLEIFFEKAAVILDDYVVSGFQKRYRSLMIQRSGSPPELVDQQAIDESYYDHIGRPPIICPEMVSAYRYQALAFVHSLLDQKTVIPDLNTGLKAHQLIESIYASARDNCYRKTSLM